MTIHRLTATKAGDDTVFSCPACRIPGEYAYGAVNKAEMVHLFICPRCQTTLAEWAAIDDRTRELKELADKAAI
jgi:hypothetical protein